MKLLAHPCSPAASSMLSGTMVNFGSFHSRGRLTNLTRSPTFSFFGTGIYVEFTKGWFAGSAFIDD